MMPRAEFDERMEALIAEVKQTPMAPGVEEIFFPGEIEDRNTSQNRPRGIPLPDNTWNSLTQLAAETGAQLPRRPSPSRRDSR